ncbi:MAG: DUF4345 domain-containing protein [Gammaproteobacteria bacterium]|nr:DUF4345 domain-containing protein [Gammaproteobacteria bacterium]MBT4145491.1 DUF4345 domain-containing protein [Gammaproteobacteria bacterium]MBT5221618.1 DUF4345 domain-containing protein [Gammaproteobacteria bacterium]MBT5826296.1 DUF4345 domain-containing protein [Gammaproteobacteria bacterium]MBT5965864.1 DUF4345 domain-containing protein [Gammaproteobacteria bacterium]
MLIKKYFLIFSFSVVAVIAFLYGISPQWFAQTFLDVPATISLDAKHILRAVMGLYLVLGVFWLFAAFSEKYRNFAVLSIVLFAGGLVSGRIISLFIDGQPSGILMLYVAMEFVFVPIAYWVFRLPD